MSISAGSQNNEQEERKMGKKIGGIILIVCALFTAFLGIKAAENAPGNQEIIKATEKLSPISC